MQLRRSCRRNHLPAASCAARPDAAYKFKREYTPKPDPSSRKPPPGPSVSVKILFACSSDKEGNATVKRYPASGASSLTSSAPLAFFSYTTGKLYVCVDA